jgi:hypothetical protein
MHDGDHALAAAHLREALVLDRELGIPIDIAMDLERLVRATLGVPGALDTAATVAWAARLWGAAEALRERIAAPIPAEEIPHYQARVAGARQHLDAAAWEQAWAEGRAMSMEEAIAYALAPLAPPPLGAPVERSG